MRVLADRSTLLIAALAILWLAMLLLGGPNSSADAALRPLFHHPALVPAALALTRLGNAYVLLPLSLLATLLVAWRTGRHPALVYLILILSGRFLVELEKNVIGRARPDPTGRLDTVISLSFPNAHAANSMVAWLGLALVAAPARLRVPAVAAALILAFAVGLTRLVLAVHWPSDVIGAAWTLLVLRLAERISPALRPG